MFLYYKGIQIGLIYDQNIFEFWPFKNEIH